MGVGIIARLKLIMTGREPRQKLVVFQPEPGDKSREPTGTLHRDASGRVYRDVSVPLPDGNKREARGAAPPAWVERARHFRQMVELVRRRRLAYRDLIYEGDPKAPVLWIHQEFQESVEREILLPLYGLFRRWVTGPDGMPVCLPGVITEEEYTVTSKGIRHEIHLLEVECQEWEDRNR